MIISKRLFNIILEDNDIAQSIEPKRWQKFTPRLLSSLGCALGRGGDRRPKSGNTLTDKSAQKIFN